MSDNVPPPPGGYGTPYRAPQDPLRPPPDDLPPPPRHSGRWAAGGIAFVILGLRACLLFARLDESSTPSYSYTPLPTYDPATLFPAPSATVPIPKLPKLGGHVVAQGEAVVHDDEGGTIRKGSAIVCEGFCTVNALAVAGEGVYWITALDGELRSVPLAGGEPHTVAKLREPGSWIASDGSALIVEEASSLEPDAKRGLFRVDPKSGQETKLVLIDGEIRDVVVSAGRVYFAWTSADSPGLHLRSIASTGGALSKLADSTLDEEGPFEGAVGGGYYYVKYGGLSSFQDHVGRVPIAGGTFETVYDASPAEMLGPIAADASGLYLVHHTDAWRIGHFEARGRPLVELDGTLVRAPQNIALRKKDVAFTFDGEVQFVPKTPVKSPDSTHIP